VGKGPFIATQLNLTQQHEQQLTQFVGRDVINKNTTDLAVYAVQLGQLSSVELCRYKHPLMWVMWSQRTVIHDVIYSTDLSNHCTGPQ